MKYIKKWRNTSIKEIIAWNYLNLCKVRHIPKELSYVLNHSLIYSWEGVKPYVLEIKHIIQCIEFLYDLKKNNLCHGDININNILIYKDNITFIDFETLSLRGSSYNKTSPYYLLNYKYTSFKNDRFALWVTLCCIILKEYGQDITKYNPKIPFERRIIHNTVKRLRSDLAFILDQIYHGVPYEEILEIETVVKREKPIINTETVYYDIIDDLIICRRLMRNLNVKEKDKILRLIEIKGIHLLKYVL